MPRKDPYKKYILRICSTITLICFLVSDIAGAYPVSSKTNSSTLAAQTVFTGLSHEDTFFVLASRYFSRFLIDIENDPKNQSVASLKDSINREIKRIKNEKAIPGKDRDLIPDAVIYEPYKASILLDLGPFKIRYFNHNIPDTEFPEKNDPGRSYKVVQEKVGKYLTRQVIIQKAVTLQVPWYNRKIALVLSEEKIRENLEEVKKIVPEIYKTLSKNIIRRGDDIICTHIENADIGKHIEALKFFREMIADTEINSEKMEKYILDFHSQMKDTTILEVKQGPRSEKHEEIFQKIIDEIFVEENRERIKEDPIKFAAHSFVKIVRAQPFYNGNHRVANIVMNFILIKNGLPQFMLNKDNAVRYYSLTNWYYLLKDRFDIGEITEFFRQEILSKQKEITQKESWYNPQIDIVIPKEAIRDELRKVVEMAPKISASMPEHEGIAESIDKKEVLEDVIPKKKKHEENFGSLIKRYVAWIMKNLKPIRSSVADIEELILSQGWQINSDEVREYVHKWKKIVDAYPPQGERIEQHAVRTALLSVMIYSRLKLNGDRTLKGLDEVVTAALAHDLGKTNKELLRYFLKKGLLFPSERERIKRHVKKSLTMLKNAGVHVNGNISKAIIEHHPEYGNGEPATEVSRVLYAADQIDARQDVSRSDRRKGSLARWDEEAILHNLVPALSREWIDEDIYGVLVALIREKNANYFKIITATYFLWERGLLWFRLKFWFRSRDKGSGEEIKKLQDAEKNVSIKTSTLPPTFSLGHWWYNRIRKLNLNDEEIWKRTATNIAPWVEEFVNIGIPYGMFALFERYGEVITLSGLTAFFATSIIVGTSFIFLHLFNRRGPPKEADSLRNKWSDVLQAPFMVYSLAFFFSSFGIVFLSEIPLLIRFIGVFVVAGGYHKLINCAIADLRSGEYVMLGSYHNKKEGFEHDSLSNVIKKGGVLVHELSNLFSGIYNEIELGAVQYILDKKDVPREFKEMQDASEKVNNGMKSMRGLIGELKRRSLGQEESPKSIKYNAMDEGALMTELASEAEKLAENLEYIKNCDIERLVPIFKGKGEAIRARLSFARIKARAFFLDKEFDTEGDQRPVNVNDTINLMRDCLGKRSSRVFFVPGDVRPVMADKMLLASVWDNLRKNALEAMDDAGDNKGKVYIRTGFEPDLNMVVISVKDTGTGILPENQHRVFELFFTSKGTKGTGLGLHVSKEIIENAGGTIDFVSKPGEGTTFTVQLPAVPIFQGSEKKNELQKTNKGDILAGFNTIFKEKRFKSGNFSRKEFQEVRKKGDGKKFSYTTITTEVEGMVKLGILRANRKNIPILYDLAEKYRTAKYGELEDVRFILSKLPARPDDGQLKKAKEFLKDIELYKRSADGRIRDIIKEKTKLSFYVREVPKLTLELIKLYTERGNLMKRPDFIETEEGRLNELLERVYDIIETLREDILYIPDPLYSLDITFGRNYREEIRDKVQKAIDAIARGNEPPACTSLWAVSHLLAEELFLIEKAGKGKRTRSVWDKRRKKIWAVLSGQYVKHKVEGETERDVFIKEKKIKKSELFWQAIRARDREIDRMLDERDLIKGKVERLNEFIEALDEEKRDRGKLTELGLTQEGEKEFRELLLEIWDLLLRAKVKEKDIALEAIRSATELLKIDEYGNMLELLRVSSTLLMTRVESLEGMINNIIKGRLRELRSKGHERNSRYIWKTDKVISFIEEGEKERALGLIFGMLNDWDTRKEPEFYRMNNVLGKAKSDLERDDIESVKKMMSIMKKRVELMGLLNSFVEDFRDTYVDARLENESEKHINSIFDQKFDQYLKFAQESNIGRGSPRLVRTLFYLPIHVSINMPDPEKPSKKIKNPLFTACLDLIRILEINDIDILVRSLDREKKKFPDLYDLLKQYKNKKFKDLDSLSRQDYRRLLAALSKDARLDEMQTELLFKTLENIDSLASFSRENDKIGMESIGEILPRVIESLITAGHEVSSSGISEKTESTVFSRVYRAATSDTQFRKKLIDEWEKDLDLFNFDLVNSRKLSSVIREVLINSCESIERKHKELDNDVQENHIGEIKIEADLFHDTLSIQIEDNGVGIGTTDIPRSSKGKNGGSGLVYCRETLHQAGGVIVWKDKEDGGTSVTISLPISSIKDYNRGMIGKLELMNVDGEKNVRKKSKDQKIGIFIDERLGDGSVSGMTEMMEKMAYRNDLLGKLLNNVVIKRGNVEDVSRGLEGFVKKKNIRKEDMVIITRDEDISVLEDYEGISVITKVDDSKMKEDAYYPILEIILFTVARMKILEYTKDDLEKIYRSIPNAEELSADDVTDLCWDQQNGRSRSTIVIRLGLPDADTVTADTELYNKIANYIEQNA